ATTRPSLPFSSRWWIIATKASSSTRPRSSNGVTIAVRMPPKVTARLSQDWGTHCRYLRILGGNRRTVRGTSHNLRGNHGSSHYRLQPPQPRPEVGDQGRRARRDRRRRGFWPAQGRERGARTRPRALWRAGWRDCGSAVG